MRREFLESGPRNENRGASGPAEPQQREPPRDLDERQRFGGARPFDDGGGGGRMAMCDPRLEPAKLGLLGDKPIMPIPLEPVMPEGDRGEERRGQQWDDRPPRQSRFDDGPQMRDDRPPMRDNRPLIGDDRPPMRDDRQPMRDDRPPMREGRPPMRGDRPSRFDDGPAPPDFRPPRQFNAPLLAQPFDPQSIPLPPRHSDEHDVAHANSAQQREKISPSLLGTHPSQRFEAIGGGSMQRGAGDDRRTLLVTPPLGAEVRGDGGHYEKGMKRHFDGERDFGDAKVPRLSHPSGGLLVTPAGGELEGGGRRERFPPPTGGECGDDASWQEQEHRSRASLECEPPRPRSRDFNRGAPPPMSRDVAERGDEDRPPPLQHPDHDRRRPLPRRPQPADADERHRLDSDHRYVCTHARLSWYNYVKYRSQKLSNFQ